MLCADDNLTPLALLTDSSQLCPILSLYNKYIGVSGLNINIAETTAICINTPAPLWEQLLLLKMVTPNNPKHLGILLGKTINFTVEITMVYIEPKAIKRRIMAMMPPSLMCYTEPHSLSQPCSLSIIMSSWPFQWNPHIPHNSTRKFSASYGPKQVDGQTKQKRRLVMSCPPWPPLKKLVLQIPLMTIVAIALWKPYSKTIVGGLCTYTMFIDS